MVGLAHQHQTQRYDHRRLSFWFSKNSAGCEFVRHRLRGRSHQISKMTAGFQKAEWWRRRLRLKLAFQKSCKRISLFTTSLPCPTLRVYNIFPTRGHVIRHSHAQAMWISDREQCKVKRAILAASNMSRLQIKTLFISCLLSPISLQKAPVSWYHFNGIQCEQLERKNRGSEAEQICFQILTLLCPQRDSG